MKYKIWYVNETDPQVYRYYSYGTLDLNSSYGSSPRVNDVLGTIGDPLIAIKVIKVEEIE